jgi:hypothetical protein
VPAADELQAVRLPELVSTMRDAMTTLRYRWLDVRIGGPAATMRGQWRVLAIAVVLIFGCFFAIGRVSSSGGAAQLNATATEAPSSRPAIPNGLSGGPPTGGSVPSAIAPKPAPVAHRSSTARQSAPTPVVVSSLPAQSAGTQASPSAAETTPAATPAPVQTPAPATKQAPQTTSGGGSSGGSAGSGNGSFDSSE